jgi:hypothetical protein
MNCENCGDDGFTCEQCGRVQCMGCFRRYSWQATSRLCWQCQNEADKEWLAQWNGWGLPKAPTARRTWPRGGTP